MASIEQGADPAVIKVLDEAARLADASHVFAHVERRGGLIECVSRSQPEASFRIEISEGSVFVCWACGDRYISQSIEADLMWTGDDLDDLIGEELVEQGYLGGPLGAVEHFRDEQKKFIFRSRISSDPRAVDARALVQCLLAYNDAFAPLGDMKEEDES